jgi:hypothetical protein
MTITLSNKRIDVDSTEDRSDESINHGSNQGLSGKVVPVAKTHGAKLTNMNFESSADSPLRHNDGGEEAFAWKSVRIVFQYTRCFVFC